MAKKDICDRDLKDYDVVVVNGKEVGIFIGKSVRTLTGTRTSSNIFLVENPSSTELKIKDDILRKMEQEKEEARIKKEVANQKIANEVGRIYEMKNGDVFLYCGKRKISIYKNDALIYQGIGHFYLPDNFRHLGIGAFSFETFLAYSKSLLSTYSAEIDFKISSSFKKFNTAYSIVKVPDTFEFCGTHTYKQKAQDPNTGRFYEDWDTVNNHYRVIVEKV